PMRDCAAFSVSPRITRWAPSPATSARRGVGEGGHARPGSQLRPRQDKLAAGPDFTRARYVVLGYRAPVIVGDNSRLPIRLVEVLRALPESEVESLVSRLGIRIDPAKR